MAGNHDLTTPEARLAWARGRLYDDAKQFADAVGINAVTYRAYETGQNGFAKHAVRFAAKLGVPTEWLLEGIGSPPKDAPPRPEPDIPAVVTNEDAVMLRQVDLAYSMGPGSNIEDYPDEGAIQFDANLLSTITRSPPERLFVARGAGDSMFPTLLNDDMVVIDSLQRTLNMQDRIWAISLHGAGGIKRLRTIGKGRVLVISDNKDVENQEADADDLFIAGRVIWVGRRV